MNAINFDASASIYKMLDEKQLTTVEYQAGENLPKNHAFLPMPLFFTEVRKSKNGNIDVISVPLIVVNLDDNSINYVIATGAKKFNQGVAILDKWTALIGEGNKTKNPPQSVQESLFGAEFNKMSLTHCINQSFQNLKGFKHGEERMTVTPMFKKIEKDYHVFYFREGENFLNYDESKTDANFLNQTKTQFFEEVDFSIYMTKENVLALYEQYKKEFLTKNKIKQHLVDQWFKS